MEAGSAAKSFGSTSTLCYLDPGCFDFSVSFLEDHSASLQLVSDHSGELGSGGDIEAALEVVREVPAGD